MTLPLLSPPLRRALATLPIYLEYLVDTQAFDDTAFRAWLASRGRSRPAPAIYLSTVLDYYLAQRLGAAQGGAESR